MKMSGHFVFVFILSLIVVPVARAQTYSLGMTNRVEMAAAGTDSVVLAVSPETGTWAASANASWLHLGTANQSGTGSTNVVFSFDANAGPTRTGTLTIGGQTLNVTQASATYVAANPFTRLATLSMISGIYIGVAVDGAGNVFVADSYSQTIKEWTAANNTVSILVSSGLNNPQGVAVDGAGNVYIADTGNNAIKKWTAASSNVTALAASGLNNPQGVAVDGAGNVYIADTGNNAIKEWTATSSNVTTLVASGLSNPGGVAVDGAGNVYIADTGNNAIKKWTAASSNVITLVASGLSQPQAVAVDGAGDVYVANLGNSTITEWMAASGNMTTLAAAGLYQTTGVAVDGAGNVFIGDEDRIEEVPRAFVDPTPKVEPLAAGGDVLPVVLPPTQNLTGPLAPLSDTLWLTITGITNGVASFAFTATANNRTAELTVLGQIIYITQGGPAYSLGTTNLLEGPAMGTDSVVLAVSPPTGTWTASTNATWLHLSAASQSGTGSTNVIFSFDANPGSTRTSTLTIGGQTLNITQAGASYVAANPLTTLVSGLNNPYSVAVDNVGNLYIADTFNKVIKKWTAANTNVTTLISVLNYSLCVAVDCMGNIYFSKGEFGNNCAIEEWTVANTNFITLVSSGLYGPYGVAVDGAGNVYFSDYGFNVLNKWTAANSNVTTLVSSGLSMPSGVAVDVAGNVYIADFENHAVKKWTSANSTVTTLAASGVGNPRGVAVDGAGNVYIADADEEVYKWTAASGIVTTLVSGLYSPYGVAVDGAGNVYIADTYNNAIKELCRAFVDPTTKMEPLTAGSDVLPVVLPATENLGGPFTPSCDSSWLTITGITNGVVSFAFTANNSVSNRTANITLLGQTVPVTQNAVPVTPPILIGAQLTGGVFSFAFSNNQGASFTVWTTTNVALPLADWTVAGTPTNNGSGLYQFATPTSANDVERFYRVSSP
jgi:sugar lactone lactonase YvrE